MYNECFDQFLRTLFLRTRNVHYCTLRSELLMALHDREVQDVISVDPCHKFTWCLDACIRERNVDVKRSRELQGFLDAIRYQAILLHLYALERMEALWMERTGMLICYALGEDRNRCLEISQ